MYHKACFLLPLFALGILSACGQAKTQEQTSEAETGESQMVIHISSQEPSASSQSKEPSKAQESAEAANPMTLMFGESCIAQQTFEVQLSEYDGSVYFVPFSPSDQEDFHIQIIQENQVLTELVPYVPDELEGQPFTSLDAVSFYDVNYDGCTDIVLIETYGGTTFAAVYYGFDSKEEDYERYFSIQTQLSQNITKNIQPLSISQIRKVLADGKKNGEFSDYKEAYQAVGRLCQMSDSDEILYGLMDIDGDDIPELAAGADGYYVSLYTYSEGRVYSLMDHWYYGAMGNSGYEYSPGKNSIRNYNTDYAGAILHTTYMSITPSHSLEITAQIDTCNFDDVNQNGVPDEEELGSMGFYSISYLNGSEASPEECRAYDAGEYEMIRGAMTLEALCQSLSPQP